MTKILSIFDVVPGWIYVAAMAGILTYGCIERAGLEVRASHAEKAAAGIALRLESERRNAADRARIESEAARAREADLQKQADEARKADRNEINRIAAERDRAIGELRNRPARPAAGTAAAGVPAVTGAGEAPAGCTGAQLYREDAEFLVGEFARAELLRSALLSCYASYDRARAATQEVTPQQHAPSN